MSVAPRPITFSAPRIKRYETDEFQPSGEPRFVAVSLNGEKCHLQCDHCRTRMLKALYHVDSGAQFEQLAARLADRGCRGMLLTGGCDADGTIPLIRYRGTARQVRLRHGFRYAVHTKLVTGEFAAACAAIGAELLMTDLVGENDSLHRVYHLRNHTIDDVRASLDRAEAHGLRLAPHIMIGIAGGRVVGERVALGMLRGRSVSTLALVVLTPLMHTPLASTTIDIPAVLEFLTEARETYPDMRITLGCAKTGGRTQRQLEEHAVRIGIDAIAYPSDGIVAFARGIGRPVILNEGCCAFQHFD
jgi:lipoyl synthase